MPHKKQKNPTPSLDSIIQANPSTQQPITIHYADADEEEYLDTAFALEPWEEAFYDEQGNFVLDGE